MIPKDKIKDLVAKYYLVEKELSLGEIDPKIDILSENLRNF